MSASASAGGPSHGGEPWTLRRLVARHKLLSLSLAALTAALLALTLAAALGPQASAVTDRTSCTQWGSANVDRQNAYAQLYVREHGPVPRWGSSPTVVINAINAGCFRAYGDGVSDSTSVVQAISGNF